MERAFDAAERDGRVLMEAFMWRFHPQTEELVRLVRDGAIGELRVDPRRVRLQPAVDRRTSAGARSSKAVR